MKTYEFSIIASGLNPEAEDFEARFYNAGCDDATIAFQKGHIIVDFAREAPSIEEAISSAVENVLSTGATIDRVEPDPLVSLSDIAARSNMTRAAISLYAKGERGRDFPAPAARVTTDSPLWDWAKVAMWLYKHDRLSREDALAAVAVSEANAAISSGGKVLAEAIKHRVHLQQKDLVA
jgi:hypothetical protein